MTGSQNLLFSYLAWCFYSWYFRGEKYWIASQIRAPRKQVCNLAWSMGQGGEFGFLPDQWFLIIYPHVPTNCLCVTSVQSVDRNPTGSVSCGWSGYIFLLPLRIVLHTPGWQALCVGWSWCTSLTHPDKRCREKQSMKVYMWHLQGLWNLESARNLEKSFTDFFVVVLFLLLPCLGVYNFPVFIWYGLVRRVLRPPRKGTFIKEACGFFFSFFMPELRLQSS